MNTTITKSKANEVFDDKILLFAEGEDIPFAYRAPSPEEAIFDFSKESLIDRIGQFKICRMGANLICRHIGSPAIAAVIAPTSSGYRADVKEGQLIEYLRFAGSLDISAPNIDKLEDVTSRLAARCGCLTDIYREKECFYPFYSTNAVSTSASSVAIALPIIALMYRRISAMRGFNFKITFSDGLPCLVFSARVILNDGQIRECNILSDFTSSSDLTFIYKVTDLNEKCDGGRLFRLSLAICPQATDPRGILHADAWKKHKESAISKIELDVPGRF